MLGDLLGEDRKDLPLAARDELSDESGKTNPGVSADDLRRERCISEDGVTPGEVDGCMVSYKIEAQCLYVNVIKSVVAYYSEMHF